MGVDAAHERCGRMRDGGLIMDTTDDLGKDNEAKYSVTDFN